MKTTVAAVVVGLFSGLVLAQQVPQAPPPPRPPAAAPVGSTALMDLIKAQTEAIKALEARVTQLEERVKKLESPR